MNLDVNDNLVGGVAILPHERLDDLHRKGYRLIQDPKLFCFGIDAVLLSGFARVKKGERVLDLCCGNGIIPILLAAKTPGEYFAGLEIQESCAAMARRSVRLNGLEDKIQIFAGDVKNAPAFFGGGSFSCVTVNPPYMNAGGGLVNDFSPKAIARHELLCSLEDILAAAAKLLVPGGRLYLVHRPHRLGDIFAGLRAHKLEPKTMRLVHPRQGAAPNLVLVEALRGGNPWLKVEPPLIVYGEDGGYTKETREIYYGP